MRKAMMPTEADIERASAKYTALNNFLTEYNLRQYNAEKKGKPKSWRYVPPEWIFEGTALLNFNPDTASHDRLIEWETDVSNYLYLHKVTLRK